MVLVMTSGDPLLQCCNYSTNNFTLPSSLLVPKFIWTHDPIHSYKSSFTCSFSEKIEKQKKSQERNEREEFGESRKKETIRKKKENGRNEKKPSEIRRGIQYRF